MNVCKASASMLLFISTRLARVDEAPSARIFNARSWTALFRAFSSHWQLSASLIKGIPQLDKTLGQTGQTLMACTVAEAFLGINDFGNRSDFPRVDHEGRQTFCIFNLRGFLKAYQHDRPFSRNFG